MDVALGQTDQPDYALVGQVIQEYLASSNTQSEDLAEVLLDVRTPVKTQKEDEVNPLVQIVGPIMGGMMIFYAFYTGTSTAGSILREEEERTLPRLFTTPTPQSTILTGKFLSVFTTVVVQVIVLLSVARLIFQIEWGAWTSVALVAAGIVFSASSFGIFVNSMLKSTKQAGGIFGGVLTLSGMIGMIGVFAAGSSGGGFADTVSLLVPQGWAVRGLVQAMNGEPFVSVLLSFLVLLAWSTVFFVTGVMRFNRRYV
jgi:ABC-2 type transport system permease protein